MKTPQFDIYSPRDHVRKRTGLWLGSTALETTECFIEGKWKSVKHVPALNKMIDEIIDNSLDEAIRTNFKHANKISVVIHDDTVEVHDNGRGIPQDSVKDSNTEEIISKPFAAWTKIMSGTSFDDQRVTIGANGVGSACVNFMSEHFTGITWSNSQITEIKTSFGLNPVEKVKQTKNSSSGTSVIFKPDFNLLEINNLQDNDTVQILQSRLSVLAILFPKIRFKLNNERLRDNTITRYAEKFKAKSESSVVVFDSKNIKMFFTYSETGGFLIDSHVNGVNTKQGGTYIDFIIGEICAYLIPLIKKKHKILISKSLIKTNIIFGCFISEFQNPAYDSQTKQRLTSSWKDVRNHWRSNDHKFDFEKIAQKILSANDILEPIISAYEAKRDLEDTRNAIHNQKKIRKIKIAKHIESFDPKNSTLFIVEGNSASGFFMNVADRKKAGLYPLSGKIPNIFSWKNSEILKHHIFSEIIAILGLNLLKPDDISSCTYNNIGFLTDADHDGNHISSLLMLFFYKCFPILYEQQRIRDIKTPIAISSHSSLQEDIWHYTYENALKYKEDNPKHKHRYIKGLASLTSKEYSKIINDPVFNIMTVKDENWFEVAFGGDSLYRKQWILNKKIDIIQEITHEQ